jgi:uncharacterized membrane protein YhaH (DUF805 family)
MDMSMFTGFAGRINRAKWWLGTVILIVVSIILYFILAAVFGVSSAMMDPAQMASALQTLAIIQLILVAILAYPITALMMKRLNDRDRPGYFAYIFWAPTIVSVVGGLLGLTMTTTDMGGGVMMPTQSGLGWALTIIGVVIGIWSLIELGILKGTDGPNQHGPDPLAT